MQKTIQILLLAMYTIKSQASAIPPELLQDKKPKTMVDQIQQMKQSLQQYSLEHDEKIFQQLHQYGRMAGRVASAMVMLAHKKKESCFKQSKLSQIDQLNIIQIVISSFVLLVEYARYCSQKKHLKNIASRMTYEEFVQQFPNLLLIEYQILLMKTFISMTESESLAEQIFGCIHLTRMSLPKPYEKFAEKATKKMYKKCFDNQGNLVFLIQSGKKHPYKKFSKKVAQSWQSLILIADQLPCEIEGHYESSVALCTQTPVNNALVDMVYAASRHDRSTVERLHEQFGWHGMVENLFENLKS